MHIPVNVGNNGLFLNTYHGFGGGLEAGLDGIFPKWRLAFMVINAASRSLRT